MMVLIFFLLVLREECCAADPFIDAKSINVGDHVTMICSRKSAGDIYWMRIAFGNSLKYVTEKLHDSLYSHIKVKPEAGTLELRIISAKLNDSALYLCVRKYQENITHMNATYLKVEEMAVTGPPPTVTVHPKDPVTQCSVLRYSLNKSCPVDDTMYCFRAEFNQNHSSFNHTQKEEEFKNILEGFTAQKCFHNHLKNFSSSGVWMHHCGVSVPEEKIYDKSEHHNKGECPHDSNNYNTILNLLCAALAICLVIIIFLIYYIKQLEKKLNGCSDATVSLQVQAPLGGNEEGQQMDEDSLIYSAPVFTSRRVSQKVTKGTTPGEAEAIYTEVKCTET